MRTSRVDGGARPPGARTAPLARVLLAALLAAVPFVPTAQFPAADPRPPAPLDGAELRLALKKLRVLGSALFVAAHPDDENTALLAYLSRERRVRAGYLSVTRGDGGQNLVGSESGEALGVLRTQELLAARRVDGAEQFFTRALDFGYSKSPDETIRKWGREEILADMVWVIRRFRPDIVITRFPRDGGGHGHHTASALLAEEAFEAAGDPRRFPDQLALAPAWQPRRLLWNAWRVDTAGRDPARPPRLELDLGLYSPLLGRSYSEVAGESRSMHKSQGFGSPERRGSIPNWLEHLKGAPARLDPFEGVDLTWRRVPGGEQVDRLLAEAERRFDPERPHELLPVLLRAHAALSAAGSDPWVEWKRRDLLQVLRACAGLWVEAVAAAPSASPGGEVRVTLTALNRSPAALTLERIELPHGASATAFAPGADGRPDSSARREVRDRALAYNQPVTGEARLRLPEDSEYTQPYWLRRPAREGRSEVDDPELVGLSENPPPLVARFVVRAGTERLRFETPVVYRWTDPVEGERYRSFEVLPPATLRLDQRAYVFPDTVPREVRVTVEGGDAPLAGRVRLELPPGWRAEPETRTLELGRGAEESARFLVHPGSGPWSGTLRARFESGGKSYGLGRVRIDHPHVPPQSLLPPCEAPLVRTEIRRLGREVGYLMGPGDPIPEALRQLGYRVALLSDDEVENGDLSRFDAIVAGVRAYNTRPRLRALQTRLLDWVASGGTLVVQYSTADPALDNRIGPFPFRISRDRVSVEEAEVRFLKPDHPLLQRPNRITPADFEGWVQERGLYFASPWDPRYETVLSSNDPDEPPRDGGLLFARHGRGVFVYTAYAWFRQLPAGVPGAYRLLANLVSAGK